MEISPLLQARLLLCSAMLGAVAAVVWDMAASAFGIWQGKGHKIWALRFAFDLVFVSLSGAAIVVLCYYFNKGGFRFFAVLGFLVAFFTCRAILGRLVRRTFYLLARLAFTTIRLISIPFVKIYKHLVNILGITIYYTWKALEKITILVYNISVRKTILKKSCKGFLGGSVKRRG